MRLREGGALWLETEALSRQAPDCCLHSTWQPVAMETMLLIWSLILVIHPQIIPDTPSRCQPPRLPQVIHVRGTGGWRWEGQLVLVGSRGHGRPGVWGDEWPSDMWETARCSTISSPCDKRTQNQKVLLFWV